MAVKKHLGLIMSSYVAARTNDAKNATHPIWGSGKTVNPRHTYGHWLLVQKYETSNGRSRVSKRSPL